MVDLWDSNGIGLGEHNQRGLDKNTFSGGGSGGSVRHLVL